MLRAGFLEIMSESNYVLEQSGNKHYMKGGKAGAFPSLKGVMPHPVPLGKPPSQPRSTAPDLSGPHRTPPAPLKPSRPPRPTPHPGIAHPAP